MKRLGLFLVSNVLRKAPLGADKSLAEFGIKTRMMINQHTRNVAGENKISFFVGHTTRGCLDPTPTHRV